MRNGGYEDTYNGLDDKLGKIIDSEALEMC